MTEKIEYQLKSVLDTEWSMISRIMDFNSNYLFRDNWGTINDWCKYLNYKSPTLLTTVNFVKMLISINVLNKNGIVIKDGKRYDKYILTKDYENIFRDIVIEKTEIFNILNRWYDIYVP